MRRTRASALELVVSVAVALILVLALTSGGAPAYADDAGALLGSGSAGSAGSAVAADASVTAPTATPTDAAAETPPLAPVVPRDAQPSQPAPPDAAAIPVATDAAFAVPVPPADARIAAPPARADAAVIAGPPDAGITALDAGLAASSGSGSGSGSGSATGTSHTSTGSPVVQPPLTLTADTTPVAMSTPPPSAPAGTSAKSLDAIKVIGGLVALLVLAYLGGHRRVVRFQERLGLSGVITAGFPFVAIGLVAALPQIGILDSNVVDQLRPLLMFGLGWLGFIIGAQLDIRVLDRVPKGTAYIILVEALGPFAVVAVAAGGVMISLGLSLTDHAVWRDVILLGTAAAMTAPRKFRGFANRAWHEGRSVDILLGQLDELVGVIGLLFITAYFRDTASATAWKLPNNTVWVFISLGLGVAIGALIFAMIRVPVSDAEFLAVVLGGIAFASGLAGYLNLSPIVVCFLAGVLVTNFPNDQRDSLFRILNHLERPVHLLFLIIAGALWDVTDWRGWVLVPLFVAARVVGKALGIFGARASVGAELPAGFADKRTLISPLSSLSIALVISVYSIARSNGPGGTEPLDIGLTWVLTAVIGGALVCELLTTYKPTQIDAAARAAEGAAAPIAPIDELDTTGATAAPRTAIDELDEPSTPVPSGQGRS